MSDTQPAAMSNTQSTPMLSPVEPSSTVRVRNVIEMWYDSGGLVNKKDAAVIAELPATTFRHRLAGRPSREEASRARQRLTTTEEEIVIWRREVLARAGFPHPIKRVREMALLFLRKRGW